MFTTIGWLAAVLSAFLFFFLLSGFGIGSSFAYKGNSAYTCKGLKSYYWRRIKAIYPASIIITLALIFLDRASIFSDFSEGVKYTIGNLFLIEIFSMFPESTQSVWYLSFSSSLLCGSAVYSLFCLAKIKWQPAFLPYDRRNFYWPNCHSDTKFR